MFRSATHAAALLFATVVSVEAAEVTAGDLTIASPVIVKSFAKARAAGGYMTVANSGDKPDLLLGVSVEGPMAMIHESREEGGIMRMVHLDAVEIPAGETVAFAPGGLHVMIMGLQPDDLPVGDTLDAVLTFDRAGEVAVTFRVEALPVDGPGGGTGHGDAMN